MKLFLVIASLLSVALAHQLKCDYVDFGDVYGCLLTINNPTGFNGFTKIEGIHLAGYSNARVGVVYKDSGVSTNVPSIICNAFPNIVSLDLHDTGLTKVDDNAFRNCPLITQLDLWDNKISSISANAFASLCNVQFLNLEKNMLTTLPSNIFANQRNLQMLYLSQNLFADFPVGIFRPLQSIVNLGIGFCKLSKINSQWFGNNTQLVDLHVGGNRLTLTAQSFVGLGSLTYLNVANNLISQIPFGTFSPLRNLRDLDIFNNTLTVLSANSFYGLTNLEYLQIGYSPIRQIQVGAFRGLGKLKTLIISQCQLRQPGSYAFEDLKNLTSIDLSQNGIEDLGTFLVPLSNLREATLHSNNLTTIRRSNFGTVTSLDTLNLDANRINALDKKLIDAAVNFSSLFFTGNNCADELYLAFTPESRVQSLQLLQTCFKNYNKPVGHW